MKTSKFQLRDDFVDDARLFSGAHLGGHQSQAFLDRQSAGGELRQLLIERQEIFRSKGRRLGWLGRWLQASDTKLKRLQWWCWQSLVS